MRIFAHIQNIRALRYLRSSRFLFFTRGDFPSSNPIDKGLNLMSLNLVVLTTT
jgi:hypothetical protein